MQNRGRTWTKMTVMACTLGLALTVGAGALVAQTNGDAEFSHPITWKNGPPLYFSIDDGPANTCGSLEISRNGGAWTSAPGWICTNSSGDATKGPWYWADQTGDETAEAYILWPDATFTNTDVHIWDVQRPTVAISSSCTGGPPSCWSGTASDGIWGACFDSSWAFVWSRFYDVTAARYYDSGTGAYSSIGWVSYYGSFTSLPSCSPGWLVTAPPSGAHVSGHSYEWTVTVFDGGQSSLPAVYTFTY